MNPRRAALVGLVFPAIAVGYFAFSSIVQPSRTEPAAIVLLVALGVATSLMAYVLVAGLSRN